MKNKFGPDCLEGKRGKHRYTYTWPGFPEVEISVDDSIILNDGRRVLIEVDSENQAKLLVGQYTLINLLLPCEEEKNNSLFLVVHYYRASKSKKLYNRDRTLKNLNAIQHISADVDWMPFNAYNIEEFKKIVKKAESLEDLVSKVWPNNVN